jgi:hypothetical protein
LPKSHHALVPIATPSQRALAESFAHDADYQREIIMDAIEGWLFAGSAVTVVIALTILAFTLAG